MRSMSSLTIKTSDYIQVCGRRNPKIEQCILNSVENLRSKICDGIPELDVPSINPMTFKDINFIDTPSMKVYLKRVNTSGLCNFNVTYLRGDPIKLHYDIELKMNHVIFDIDYDFNIRLLVPIEHKGLLNLYLGT
ncbi:hypothetical protein PUN28_018779 [Cardiocondyla obscurior]|uniref:Uncharacterized protein n=1 Tax=Cardiocondyla obscurior TaxID=286306 RepID=A0AAW2EDW5_9HYME